MKITESPTLQGGVPSPIRLERTQLVLRDLYTTARPMKFEDRKKLATCLEIAARFLVSSNPPLFEDMT